MNKSNVEYGFDDEGNKVPITRQLKFGKGVGF